MAKSKLAGDGMFSNSKSIYEKVIGLAPEIFILPVGQGILFRLTDNFELHANLRHRGEGDEVLLNFYCTGENTFDELASYEIVLNHPTRIAQVSILRQEQKQSLRSCFARISGLPIQSRELITRSGISPVNEHLYSTIRDIIPRFDEAKPGVFLSKDSILQKYAGFDVYILCNNPEEAVLEISPMDMDGLSTMTVALDKGRQMAGVVEINGAAGRYPFYLPYPDGKEMAPAERNEYSRMLCDRLQKASGITPRAEPYQENDLT